MYVCARFIFCVEGADRLANAKDKQAPHVSPLELRPNERVRLEAL